jgi:hypothetical protein
MKKRKARPALGFTDNEQINGDPNGIFPLVITANILGHNVGRCMIDEGSPMDIFKELGLNK